MSELGSGGIVEHFFDGRGYIVNIGGSDSCDANSAILSHIHMMLAYHPLTLLSGQSSKRKHPNLFSNMIPISFRFLLLQ